VTVCRWGFLVEDDDHLSAGLSGLHNAVRFPDVFKGEHSPWLCVEPLHAPRRELLDRLSAGEAFGRAAEPWEVAATVAFLASDYSRYLTGEVISVSSQHP
jgi:NAD(P)-dependent dehydrogenase (short-subunit alcohol dehydrogenase family)